MSTPLRSLRNFIGMTLLVGGCDDAPLFTHPPDAGPDAAPYTAPFDAGGPPLPDADACAPVDGWAMWPDDAQACWRRAPWATGCTVEVADHPEFGVPPLTWGPCPEGSASGCEAIVTNWPVETKPPVAPLQVAMRGASYWVGAYQGWVAGWVRVAIFDGNGHPIAAYRAKVPCTMLNPLLGATRYWFGVQPYGPSTYTMNSYAESTTPAIAPVDMMSQDQSADDDLLALWIIDGRTGLIYDRLSNQSYMLKPPPPGTGGGYAKPFVVNGNVIVRYYPAFEKPEAWIWTRTKQKAEPLIQPSPEIISDFRSDGETLVWVQNPPKPVEGQGNYPPGNLWTSPFATSKAELKPTMRRPVPIVGDSVAGGGYYAFYSADNHIHVYRLADAHHWSFPLAPNMYSMFDMSFIDENYVWFTTKVGSYRQPLSTLGPGDPAP